MLERSLENQTDDSTTACQLANFAGSTVQPASISLQEDPTPPPCRMHIGQSGAVELHGPDCRGDPS